MTSLTARELLAAASIAHDAQDEGRDPAVVAALFAQIEVDFVIVRWSGSVRSNRNGGIRAMSFITPTHDSPISLDPMRLAYA